MNKIFNIILGIFISISIVVFSIIFIVNISHNYLYNLPITTYEDRLPDLYYKLRDKLNKIENPVIRRAYKIQAMKTIIQEKGK